MRTWYAGAVLVALVATTALAGCSDDAPADDAPTVAAALPDDLCTEIPERLRADWQLEPAANATEGDDEERTASCRMTGTRGGGPVELAVRVTSYGDLDDTAAADRMADALAEGCASLEGEGTDLSFEREDGACQVLVPVAQALERGYVHDLSRITTRSAVLEIEMSHDGPSGQLVPAEVEGLAGSLLSTLG